MHEFTPEIERVAQEILEYSLLRLKENPPLDGPKTEEELFSLVGRTITAGGLGGSETLKLFTDPIQSIISNVLGNFYKSHILILMSSV